MLATVPIPTCRDPSVSSQEVNPRHTGAKCTARSSRRVRICQESTEPGNWGARTARHGNRRPFLFRRRPRRRLHANLAGTADSTRPYRLAALTFSGSRASRGLQHTATPTATASMVVLSYPSLRRASSNQTDDCRTHDPTARFSDTHQRLNRTPLSLRSFRIARPAISEATGIMLCCASIWLRATLIGLSRDPRNTSTFQTLSWRVSLPANGPTSTERSARWPRLLTLAQSRLW
jgi:hypothetical protein